VIVAVAFVPGPPVLVPEVAAGAAGELDDVRAACAQALDAVLAAERVVVLGAADGAGRWPGDAAGSLRGFGVDVLAGGSDDPVLPAPLTVAAWLLDRAGHQGAREYRAVADDATPEECARLGTELAADPRPTALVVVGEGSARLSAKAPGALDGRAGAFEAAVADALGTADRGALAGLDAGLATALMVSGRAPWQVAAAAWAEPQPPVGRLLAHTQPYGVGYLVATWTPAGR
jgi:hypothetical protein